jgi:hypothetical protein
MAAILVISATALQGCRSVSVTYDPATGAVTKRKLNGMWEIFMDSVDRDITSEKRGESPPAVKNSWKDYWIWRVEILNDGTEKHSKHINYIIDQRRKAGLPEIPAINR